ncbi:MAG: DNA mismatch endonuclease Vsr [Gammaproteobacteria bacterium]|nr:DNA mismatch endonuclease Vsr [Gammaproteobacteria bacterium]MYJ74149.1 DNA mismatch endonuclease Vsr [Gammaproteobacteria bacterium]
MVDRVDRATRSRIMASIRGANTTLELAVRKALHARGFRYRVHVKGLPGRPDIVFRRFNAVIFVNGCFWHMHDCSLFRRPTSRPAFWEEKLLRNRERDARVRGELHAAGWRCLTVWECSIRGSERREFGEVVEHIARWLTGEQSQSEIRGTGRLDDSGRA